MVVWALKSASHKKELVLHEEAESLEFNDANGSLSATTEFKNESSADEPLADGNKPSSHVTQRVIVYGILLVFVVIALNDYRLRTAWESDYQILSDSLIHSKGLPQETSSAELVELMQDRKGVDLWLEERGYQLAEDRSSHKLRVYVKSSGFRQFWLVVDYHVSLDTQEQPVLTTINFTPESYYFWHVQEKSPTQSKTADRIPSDAIGESGTTTMQDGAPMGGTPMGGTPGMSGGRPGQGARGNGGQRRNINPEERFAELDENEDDILTDPEFTNRLRDNLERFDDDGDGQVTKKEFLDTMTALMAAARQNRRSNSPDRQGSQNGGGLYDVPDDPGDDSDQDPNRLPEQ
ncbi:MAG: hypothetical protein CMJ76_16575 [Planctomycetaceae bacterium]|nr:hypothetical protein [Planctomycetaceae bacterium]